MGNKLPKHVVLFEVRDSLIQSSTDREERKKVKRAFEPYNLFCLTGWQIVLQEHKKPQNQTHLKPNTWHREEISSMSGKDGQPGVFKNSRKVQREWRPRRDGQNNETYSSGSDDGEKMILNCGRPSKYDMEAMLLQIHEGILAIKSKLSLHVYAFICEHTLTCVLHVRAWEPGSACVQLYGEKGGALSRGPSSPDLKRDSFIIANLQNINMRASTQALSQGQEVTLPWLEVRDCTSAVWLFVCSDYIITNHFYNCSFEHFVSVLLFLFVCVLCACVSVCLTQQGVHCSGDG